MPTPSSSEKRIRVWARLAGPGLPSESMRIGEVEVGPLKFPIKFPPAAKVNPKLSPPPMAVVRTRPVGPEIESNCWMNFTDHPGMEEMAAFAHARDIHFPRAAAALSIGAERPYRFEVVGFDDGKATAAQSEISFTPFMRRELPEDTCALAVERSRAIAADDKLQRAADLFAEAIRLADVHAGETTRRAALLSYFQVIEICARRIPWTMPDLYDQERGRMASNLSRDLDKRASVQKQAQAIRASAQALDRLDGRYLGLQIDNAATVLGLDEVWSRRAREFNDLRNRKLAHGGSGATALMGSWLREEPNQQPSAFALAGTILRASTDAFIEMLKS